MNQPLVYIAGAYSSDPVGNTRRALGVGAGLMDDGRCAPFVPHQSLLFDLLHPRPVDDWYRLDLVILERCDAVYRLLGDSTGADLEVRHAETHGIPVFYETDPQWIAHTFAAWLDRTPAARAAAAPTVTGGPRVCP